MGYAAQVNPVLILGIASIVAALGCYSAAFMAQERRRKITRAVLSLLAAGVLLDLLATVCMLTIARGPIFSAHGILGFSATALMIVALALAWRHRRRAGEQPVPRALLLYVRLAYGCWVTAFVSGIVMAAGRGGHGA